MPQPRSQDDDESPLTPQEEVIVAALSTGASYGEAAEQAGVSARTVARRMGDAAFAKRVADLQRQHFGAIAGSLLAGGPEAVLTIRWIMATAERPADRLKAAALLLTHLRHVHQLVSVEVRLDEIERLLGAEPSDPGGV